MKKIVASILSGREWKSLSTAAAACGNAQFLPRMKDLSELDAALARNTLDVAFIDIEEFRAMSLNGKISSLADRGCMTVFVSEKLNPIDMRNALRAGAADFLIPPVEPEDLAGIFARAAARRKEVVPEAPAAPAPEEPKKKDAEIISFFSTKGGAGKSSLAANFSIALSRNFGARVCMIDLSLQFGDLAMILNARPSATIADVITEDGSVSPDIDSFLCPCGRGALLLPAPANPEQADMISASHIHAIFDALSHRFDYIVVDTAAAFNDVSLAALDRSGRIFHVATPIITSVKNLSGAINLMSDSLGYPDEKQKIILNRCDSDSGVTGADISVIIRRKIDYFVPSDGNIVVPALNRGTPAVTAFPQSKFSKAIVDMAASVAGVEIPAPKKSILGRAAAAVSGLFR